MKSTIVAFALAASALTGVAHAAVTHGSTVDVQTQQAIANRTVVGKTRAEVKQELVQAQRDGQIAALRSLYQGS